MKIKYFVAAISSLFLWGCFVNNPISSSTPSSTSYPIPKEEERDFTINQFALEDDEEVKLHIKGHFSEKEEIHSLSFVIDNTQESSIDRHSQVVDFDSNREFEITFPLIDLRKNRSWYNLYFLINDNVRRDINLLDITEKQYLGFLSHEESDVDVIEYYFEEWESDVKLVFAKKDHLKTTYYSLFYSIDTVDQKEELYLHVTGNSQHESLRLILQGKEIRTSDIIAKDMNGNFDAALRVDDLLVDKNLYVIKMQYQLENQTLYEEEINDYNLANSHKLQGICYRLNLYVFKATKTGKKVYYRLCNCPDNFAMDYVGLSIDDGAKLTISGTARLFPSGTYTLHISALNNNQDYVFYISPLNISSYGYIQATFDLSKMPLFDSYDVNSTKGQLQIYHDTLRLNQFWSEEWSHRKDDIGPIEDSQYRYKLVTNSNDKTYYLTKTKKA